LVIVVFPVCCSQIFSLLGGVLIIDDNLYRHCSGSWPLLPSKCTQAHLSLYKGK
jgi:hypothetical protein